MAGRAIQGNQTEDVMLIYGIHEIAGGFAKKSGTEWQSRSIASDPRSESSAGEAFQACVWLRLRFGPKTPIVRLAEFSVDVGGPE